ncbi:hypothetical protein CEXT_276261 [Caerostris extrusa]|uniref:Uncharacterized protein n=1 Tax=Caerostris extrusa TaxID=172846 RepID=A0AAV4XZU2_CAEEX|nr:hypothetical protein CEXT_276261 [Caerostris extrusa]
MAFREDLLLILHLSVVWRKICNIAHLLAKEGTSDIPTSNDSLTFSAIYLKINKQLWKLIRLSPDRIGWLQVVLPLTFKANKDHVPERSRPRIVGLQVNILSASLLIWDKTFSYLYQL